MTEVAVIERTPAEKVGRYVQLRDSKKAAEDKFDEFLAANYKLEMDKLELELLDFMNANGLDNVASSAGTAYKSVTKSVTTADPREFIRHVIGTQDFDLVDMKPNKTKIVEMVENNEALPPGVSYTTFVKVGIRRK